MTNEITFELPRPEYEEHTWMLFDEHGPSAVPPLLETMGMNFGGRAAEGDLPRSLRINGFTYMRVNRHPGSRPSPWSDPSLDTSLENVKRWRIDWLPRAAEICETLEAFDPASVPSGAWEQTLASQADDYMQVFAGIHRTAVGPVHVAGSRFREMWRAHFGTDRDADLEALLQGMPNCSLDRASMIWDLSRLLRADPELAAALDRGVAQPRTPKSAEFEAGMNELLQRFGYTSNAEMQDEPTWREDRSIPLAAIRAYARVEDGRGPREAAAVQKARREALEAELEVLAQTEPAVAALLPAMASAQQLLPNLEDHNYYSDQAMAGASRARWLSIGRWLAVKGALAAEADIFYLYRDELMSALEGGSPPSREEMTARRARIAAIRAIIPPAILGKPLPVEESSAGELLHTTESRVLRGIGSSPGSYRGRARVIEGLADASGLIEGDVLVTRNTTPPWTPFFAIIGALVTNSGGALSHASVVAREFGLPAVVGSVYATRYIKDGDMLTVDGTNGVVIIEN